MCPAWLMVRGWWTVAELLPGLPAEQARGDPKQHRAFAKQRGTGQWPVPPGDASDGTGEALFLQAEIVFPSPPRSAQPGW